MTSPRVLRYVSRVHAREVAVVAGPAAGHAYMPLSGASDCLCAAVLTESRVASWCRSWLEGLTCSAHPRTMLQSGGCTQTYVVKCVFRLGLDRVRRWLLWHTPALTYTGRHGQVHDTAICYDRNACPVRALPSPVSNRISLADKRVFLARLQSARCTPSQGFHVPTSPSATETRATLSAFSYCFVRGSRTNVTRNQQSSRPGYPVGSGTADDATAQCRRPPHLLRGASCCTQTVGLLESEPYRWVAAVATCNPPCRPQTCDGAFQFHLSSPRPLTIVLLSRLVYRRTVLKKTLIYAFTGRQPLLLRPRAVLDCQGW